THTATTEIYTLSLHDALPICPSSESHGCHTDERQVSYTHTHAHTHSNTHARIPARKHALIHTYICIRYANGCHLFYRTCCQGHIPASRASKSKVLLNSMPCTSTQLP